MLNKQYKKRTTSFYLRLRVQVLMDVQPANTMWRKLLYSGFHTPKAVTYHEPTIMWLFMIGHSLGRMETCFGPST